MLISSPASIASTVKFIRSRRLSFLAAAVFALACIPVSAQTVENCDAANNPNHILPKGSQTTDLQISAGINCIVDGSATNGVTKGVYIYRNVNIWGGGKLTFKDALIDFHAASILVENNGTLQAGSQSSPIKNPITIWLWGTAGSNPPSITCKSSASCGVPTATSGSCPNGAWASNPNLLTSMKPMNNSCTMASACGYTLPGGDDCFYQYDVIDPGGPAGAYFGRKVLAVSAGGTLTLFGAKGLRPGPIEMAPANSGTNWTRLTQTLAPGSMATSFTIDRPVDWVKGDEIVLTTTDYLPGHTEEVTVDHVTTANNVTTVYLSASTPVQQPHWGEAYDFSGTRGDNNAGPVDDPNVIPPLGTLPPGHIENRAIVALLSRNIVIASEGATPIVSRTVDHFPVSAGFYGGHTIVRQGFAAYQIQGVEFYQLGQGGAIGRYPVHFHMDRTVPQPNAQNPMNFLGTFVADSSIVDSMTRFITVHATQGVTLARNVGYHSIGHGYYLEDATEVNNRIYSNVGISVTAAINDQYTNPRNVPGLLNLPPQQIPDPPNCPPPNGDKKCPYQPGDQIPPNAFTYTSDVVTPSVFWIMNTWNDFEYNAAVGAGACGACYWMPAGGISGPSQLEAWLGYAGMELPETGMMGSPAFGSGTTPMTFKGNSCSAAMLSISTVGSTTQCNGVKFGPGTSTAQQFYSVPTNAATPVTAYPKITSLRTHATICSEANQKNCGYQPPCTGEGSGLTNCTPFIIDHYTTSFNWAETNFAAIFLRGWWELLENSAITDVQNGGLTFVSGGGYTRSDAAQGFWSILKNSVLVGNTQPIPTGGVYPQNPTASNAGPFTANGIPCPSSSGSSACLSLADGIVFVNAGFANNQRLFNIYDGPAGQINNIYSDIHISNIGKLSSCDAANGVCPKLNFMNAYTVGVLQYPPPPATGTKDCILPNAAIGWKQPNGFYYPPAFHSDNLVFNKALGHQVDIRHFVIQPAYYPGTLIQDQALIKKTYCTWSTDMFSASFTDIDRETELSDDDGTLTGLYSTIAANDPPNGPSISVTKDQFFDSPIPADECLTGQPSSAPISINNGATAGISPYEYLTTAVISRCGLNVPYNPDKDPPIINQCNTGTVAAPVFNWNTTCSNPNCFGVPLYRQLVTGKEQSVNLKPSIRMMGQNTGQRSTLTVNHGVYYVDTSLSKAVQTCNPDPSGACRNGIGNFNVFLPNQVYDFFLLFGTNDTVQTYTMYIGKKLTDAEVSAAFQNVRIGISGQNFPVLSTGGSWATLSKPYNPDTGILTVTINLANADDITPESRGPFCQPTTYCSWSGGSNPTCGCKAGVTGCDPAVCEAGVRDIDCPINGCYGFQITMPGSFVAPAQPILPPPTELYTSVPYFQTDAVKFTGATTGPAGACFYQKVPVQTNTEEPGEPNSPAEPENRDNNDLTRALKEPPSGGR